MRQVFPRYKILPAYLLRCWRFRPTNIYLLEKGNDSSASERRTNRRYLYINVRILGRLGKNLFFEWLQHFANYSKPSSQEPGLLIIDNHANQIYLMVYDFCTQINYAYAVTASI